MFVACDSARRLVEFALLFICFIETMNGRYILSSSIFVPPGCSFKSQPMYMKSQTSLLFKNLSTNCGRLIPSHN